MDFEPNRPPFNAQSIVATLAKVSRHQGAVSEAELLESARPEFVFTTADSWNGGTDYYDLHLVIPPAVYARVESELEGIEKRVCDRVQPLIRGYDGHRVTSVIIRRDEKATEAPIARPDLGPKLWTDGDFRLFVSHCSRVKADAHRLKDALADYEIAAFVAHDDIQPSLPWQREIVRALVGMDALLALITPDFVASSWCDQEVGFALGSGKLVLPVRYGADPHGFMGENQGIQAKGDTYAGIAKAIFRALLLNDNTQERLLEVLASHIENATSFYQAKRLLTLIEMAPSISEAFLIRLEAAAANNYEVAHAFGVPGRIKQLCATHRQAA